MMVENLTLPDSSTNSSSRHSSVRTAPTDEGAAGVAGGGQAPVKPWHQDGSKEIKHGGSTQPSRVARHRTPRFSVFLRTPFPAGTMDSGGSPSGTWG